MKTNEFDWTKTKTRKFLTLLTFDIYTQKPLSQDAFESLIKTMEKSSCNISFQLRVDMKKGTNKAEMKKRKKTTLHLQKTQ